MAQGKGHLPKHEDWSSPAPNINSRRGTIQPDHGQLLALRWAQRCVGHSTMIHVSGLSCLLFQGIALRIISRVEITKD